ncbi:hypothetical protein EOM86_02745, partial [Candidatus Nomurabacteria bacterium]|nr:hypothetical protein [Candidatus Nomurabacteria bacterium]
MKYEEDRTINSLVDTTLLKLEWDIDKIADEYDILIVRYKDENESDDDKKKSKDEKDRKFMQISDPVGEYVHGERICSIVHAKGYATYVLMKKHPGNRTDFQAYVRSKDEDFECDYISPRAMFENEFYGERTLFNLFLYGINRSEIDGYRYNNLTGALFVTFKDWIFKSKLQTYQLQGEIALGDRHKICLKILTRQMARLSSFKQKEREPLYKLPNFVVEEPFT